MIKKINATIEYDTEKDTYAIKLEAPLSVCWQITTKCNLNCKYCISSSGSNGVYGMDTKTAIGIINQLGKLGTNRLCFTGGEVILVLDYWHNLQNNIKYKPIKYKRKG